MMANRIVYMGTPTYSLSPLEQLLGRGFEIIGIYTQPDKPRGRGREMGRPAVKDFAEKNGIKVFQPTSLKSPESYAQLQALAPDLIVIAAYGKILPPETLEIPTKGCLNVHPSLLPRHRGSSPVAATLLAGDKVAGVTIFRVDEGVDSGPIIAQHEHNVLFDDNVVSLTDRLFEEAGKLLISVLPSYLEGNTAPKTQDETAATYCRKLTKENGLINWHVAAENLHREVRAYYGWPGSYTTWQGKNLRILEATPLDRDSSGPIGKVVATAEQGHDAIAVITGRGLLELNRIQLEGTRAMEAKKFVLGHKQFIGATLPN